MEREQKNLIVFGYGLAVILGLFAYHRLAHSLTDIVGLVLACLGVILVILTSINYRWLRGFYAGWMKVVMFIGGIITIVILSVLFYGMFAPAGIILRLLRKDLLQEKICPQVSSYWQKKDEPFNKESYTKQF